MRKTKGLWIFLMICSLILSCNSPKRQKKINDGKLFEKLKVQKGYLNALELKRLEQDFSLKFLDKYDLSGYDEEDTLAYFVRSDSYVWIASCYLGEDDDRDNPFICLKETNEKGFKMIKHGSIPVVFGECSYDLDKLIIRAGDYILVSQKGDGSIYCEDLPLVFTTDGKEVQKSDDQFRIITRNAPYENYIVFERDFKIQSKNLEELVIHVNERKLDTEMEQEIGFRRYDLRFVIRNNTIYFQDTIFK
ncbi:hypothetical protein [Fluviicola taffensis]|uniref:Lipoprotein n=1 Tax=Fluviicola taffensis (strain DSM 16823 / NCIMB 13979 / RW262) TaxID=755732 RepID=F2IC61_FLUTR|nr:hypothetical protein [Fluviicola taffensis]AEA43287.1 hypothetical protein Fluta_1292 [Fluviicola taffensis DSM 16823]